MAAMELHASRIVSVANADPLDWKSSMISRKSPSPSGKGEAVPFESIAERVLAASDFYRKYSCYELIRKRRGDRFDGPLKGIGFAFARQGSGALLTEPTPTYSVEATLTKQMKLEIRTGLTPWLTGPSRLLAKVAADITGIPVSDIVCPGIEFSLDTGPDTNGRVATRVRELVRQACEALQRKRFRSPLPIVERIDAKPKRKPRVAANANGAYDDHSWAAAVVELELDETSLEPRVVGVWACIDCGHVVNPDAAGRIISRLVIDELAACTDEVPLLSHEGDVNGRAFALRGLGDAPPIQVEFIEHDERHPAKALGSLPASTIPAAYLAALSQATGLAFDKAPVQSNDMFLQFESL
jgi:CO/xanthine dehydrogenase Mo-binding subunit